MAIQRQFEADEGQKPRIAAARTAVDELVSRIRSATNRPTDDIRRELRAHNDFRWRWFTGNAAANTAEIANEIYRKIIAYRTANEGIAQQCQTAFSEALDTLNAVLAAEEQGIPGHGTEAGNLWFQPLGAQHTLFRKANVVSGVIPQPDYADFADRIVDEPRAEPVVEKLLSDQSCWLQGKAARGKTTTALVSAFALAKQGFGAHYLDLSAEDEATYSVVCDEWLSLAKRKSVLVVIDNAHRNASLVSKVVGDWKRQDPASRASLLIVGTKVSYHALTDNEKILDWPSDTLQLEIGEANFAAIARFYVRKSAKREIEVPDRIAKNWSGRFANHLHTFCFAVLDRASTLGHADNWALSADNALNWIRVHWLHQKGGLPIDERLLENLLCLCAYGDQWLELKVTDAALPRPEAMLTHFIDRGVVMRSFQTRRGFIEHRSSLMEHGWGDLILQAANRSHDAFAIRAAAAQRFTRTGLAALSAYRVQGRTVEFEQMLKALSGMDGWWTQVANGPLGSLTGWLVLLKATSPGTADQLRQAIWDRFEATPDLLSQFTIGQLADLKGSYAADTPSEQTGWAERFLAAIVEAEPESESVFAQSLSSGIVATDLNMFYGLPVDSKFRACLAKLVTAVMPTTLDRAFASNFYQVTNLMQKLGQFLPESVGPALDLIRDDDAGYRARLDGLAMAANLNDFDPVNQLIQHQGTFEGRVGPLFYRRFETADRTALIALVDEMPRLAPWLIKALLHCGMATAANRVADIMAERRLVSDLLFGGHKVIEMIAQVCRGCSSEEAAHRYLTAMKGKLENQLGNAKTRRSIIADGLWVLANVDQVRPAKVIADRRMLDRAEPGSLEGREAGDLLRYLGVLSIILPTASLGLAFAKLLEVLSLQDILAHEWAVVESGLAGEQAPLLSAYQQQLWHAIYAISQSSGQTIAVSKTLHQAVLTALPPSREFCALVQPPANGQERRLAAIETWLSSGSAKADRVTLPCPQIDLSAV